jgi:7-cyano-7-deazaguanine synthase in queuosine biosynthesis
MRHRLSAKPMAIARHLEVLGASAARGACPWRLGFRVDQYEVRAFFRPPDALADVFDEADASLLALPLSCHLAAEVRPKSVSVSGTCSVPGYRPVFNAAINALLIEQDAYWGHRKLSTPPAFKRTPTGGRGPSMARLDDRVVVLGFSGGKDSLVCLFSLIDAGYAVVPVLVNEGDRTWQDQRCWIPKLRQLGLRPLVAYLRIQPRPEVRARYGVRHRSSYQIGWLSLVLALIAEKVKAAVVVMGLESSADRIGHRYKDKCVNHQHQKTTEHILQIQAFVQRTIHRDLRFASPIATFSDADVLRALFAGVPRAWRTFSSCGSSNSASKHCGDCDKCAYIFALLVRSSVGRQLARRIFRSDLFQDIELYRPWIDARYREANACIGERWELWDALEDASHQGVSAPVLERWADSPYRAQLPKGRSAARDGLSIAGSVLSQPVLEAAQTVFAWSREAINEA